MENYWRRYGLNLSTLEKTICISYYQRIFYFMAIINFIFSYLTSISIPSNYISSRYPFFHNCLNAVLTWINKDLFNH